MCKDIIRTMLQVFGAGFTAAGVVGVWLEGTSTRPGPVVSCEEIIFPVGQIDNTIMDHSNSPYEATCKGRLCHAGGLK